MRSESVEWTALPTPYSPVQHSTVSFNIPVLWGEGEVTYSATTMEGTRAARAPGLPSDILGSASEFRVGGVVDRHVALVVVGKKLVTQGERYIREVESHCSAAAGGVYWGFQGRDAKVLRGCFVGMLVYADVSGSSASFKKKLN